MSDGGGKSKKGKSSFHFAAGLCSGVFTAVLLQPADLLKTRVQQSRASTLRGTLRDIFSSSAAAGQSPIRQLWRGTLPSAIRTGCGSALYFGGLNMMRSSIARAEAAMRGDASSAPYALGGSSSSSSISGSGSSSLPRLSNTANLLTGALARTAAGTAMMPITVIKVRYESSMYSYRGIGSAAADILRTEGPRGFFAGWGATAVRDAPYAGLYVLFYEESKRRLGGLLQQLGKDAEGKGEGQGQGPAMKSSTGAGVNFASGVAAAGAATAMTNPFDAIKTRLQLMPKKYGNMVRAARMMLAEEGVRSMFDGLALRMGRKAISSALAWTVYEELIRRAEVRWAAEKSVL